MDLNDFIYSVTIYKSIFQTGYLHPLDLLQETLEHNIVMAYRPLIRHDVRLQATRNGRFRHNKGPGFAERQGY